MHGLCGFSFPYIWVAGSPPVLSFICIIVVHLYSNRHRCIYIYIYIMSETILYIYMFYMYIIYIYLYIHTSFLYLNLRHLCFGNVHYEMELTSKAELRKNNQIWRQLTGCVPSRSIAKTRWPQRILNESNHMWSFAYRWNHKADLTGSQAKLAAKVKNRKRWDPWREKKQEHDQVIKWYTVYTRKNNGIVGPIGFSRQWWSAGTISWHNLGWKQQKHLYFNAKQQNRARATFLSTSVKNKCHMIHVWYIYLQNWVIDRINV